MRSALRWLASNLPPRLVAALRYRRERLFVNRAREFHGPNRSVIFFTVRKCASTMTRHLLADLAKRHLGLVPLNLAAYLWDVTGEADVYSYLNRNARTLLKPYGVMYAPLRRYVDISHLEQPRALVMLRDPRDVVVSAYFSARYSHRAPANRARKARFDMRREALADVAFEDWIRAEALRTREVYSGFRTHLNREQVVTYEDMWDDFDEWLAQVERLLDVRIPEADRGRYRRLAGVDNRQGEDLRSHRRKGAPGDFRDKLDPPMINELNTLFRDDLCWLYGPDGQFAPRR